MAHIPLWKTVCSLHGESPGTHGCRVCLQSVVEQMGEGYGANSGETTPTGMMTPSTTADTNVPDMESLRIDESDNDTVGDEDCDGHDGEKLGNSGLDESVIVDRIGGLFQQLSDEARMDAIARLSQAHSATPTIGKGTYDPVLYQTTFDMISYHKRHLLGVPEVVVALTGFSTLCPPYECFDLFLSVANQRKSVFELQLSTRDALGTPLIGSVCYDWLELPTGGTKEGSWQHGVWRWSFPRYGSLTVLETDMSDIEGVCFDMSYEEVPEVVLFISGFKTEPVHNLRFKISTSNVTKTGFRVKASTWLDSELYDLSVTWLAYPSGTKHVHSGSVSTSPCGNSKKPQQINMGYESFPAGKFTKPPKVMVGLNYLDLEHGTEQNIKSFVSNVTHLGMCWNVDSWDDTVIYGGGFSYLAIEE
ncbi:hypothetical protein BJ508DRAFT_419602 [Ascobolus immersus RN42]|uniref:H-type lectin domain-containing protein n=1 Tax=Ascobolus immersus RN42 TaxID=1160509 RepID=A0A3N4HJR0_ASCIM|nr:hypothetical protein BJ508DRAFT_419602 [Ascobolus immersus RN42]